MQHMKFLEAVLVPAYPLRELELQAALVRVLACKLACKLVFSSL